MTYSPMMSQEAEQLQHEDLAWARALAVGEPHALERYERELVPVIEAQLRRRGHADDDIADVQQVLRSRLFVGAEAAIATYEGRGPLKSWVLISALREGVRLRERSARELATDDDALLAIAERDAPAAPAPEKERYREVFRIAFRQAIAALAPRDRVLLRMHVLDELTIDQLGALHGVHRATAARWIERVREQVAQEVRRAAMQQLGTDPFETDELLRWIQSRIELSLGAFDTGNSSRRTDS